MSDENKVLTNADGAEAVQTQAQADESVKESDAAVSDVDLIKNIIENYSLKPYEKKVLLKLISLLETTKMRKMLPNQNVGDSVFKMYASDEAPTEFIVDRINFDENGWQLVSYEKFGTNEISFIFKEKDYNRTFFDTAEKAIEFYKKSRSK